MMFTQAVAPCPACDNESGNQCIEEFRGANLYSCARCEVQFWYPAEMGSTDWHEVVYTRSDQRLLPLEPGHLFFLSDRQAPASGRLLDIGCGTGNFLLAAQAAGYEVTGLELNRNAAQFARRKAGLHQVWPLRLENFIGSCAVEPFDVVTFFEVLEHQDKPRDFLLLVTSCLRDGGYIALSVPNRRRWQKGIEVLDYPPNHLTRWDAGSLTNFLVAEGFDILSVREERLTVRRAAQVLSAGLRTGMVATVAGAEPPIPSDLAEMEPEAMRAALQKTSMSLRSRIASALVRIKNIALLPVAFTLLPYLRLKGHKGTYLYCLARRRD